MTPIIGAHVSTGGGLLRAVDRALQIGAECLQIFSSPPQRWQGSNHRAEELRQFRQKCQENKLTPVFVHGTYLINLASDNSFLLDNSVKSLIDDLNFSHKIGAAGVIFHLGSYAGGVYSKLRDITDTLKLILKSTPEDTQIILENAAGSGNKIGGKLEELALLKNKSKSARIKFCLDTQHAFAAGYDLRTKKDADNFVNEIEQELGLADVVAFHVNDSKIDLGKNVDRHENIGVGKIGLTGFSALLNNPALSDIPFILEVPGFEREGPDRKNVKILKGLLV